MKDRTLQAFGNQCEADFITVVADQSSRKFTVTMMDIETWLELEDSI